MNETCVLLKAKDFFPPDLPIAVFRGKNTRAVYNAETRVLYRRDFWKIFYIYHKCIVIPLYITYQINYT